MTLATHEEVVDAEIVEDFNVDDVFKPQVMHEVEVYAGPDDTVARTNLRQAGEIEKSSQWAKARLIAASTEKGRPGRPAKNLPTGRQINSKVSVSTASLDTGMHRDTITAYLNAWNAAAADGLCAPSTDLTPADGWTADMPYPDDWETYWGGNSHSRPTKTEPTVSERDWPVVPEPTPEELFQRLEKVRAQNIADGISKPPRTREEQEADAKEFVESLIGKAERQAEPATPEDKFAKALNAVGAAIRVNHGVNEAALNEDGWNVLRALGLR